MEIPVETQEQLVALYHRHHRAVLEHDAEAEVAVLDKMARLLPTIPSPRDAPG